MAGPREDRPAGPPGAAPERGTPGGEPSAGARLLLVAAVVHASQQFSRAAAPQERARAAAGELAVEQHRDAGLAEQLGGEQRLGHGGAGAGLIEEDDWAHVERANVRVQAAARGQVDRVDRGPGACGEGGGQSEARRDGRPRASGDAAGGASGAGDGGPRRGRWSTDPPTLTEMITNTTINFRFSR